MKKPRYDMIRVVRDSANARMDYWLPRELAAALGLPFVQVYNNERSCYDPEGKYRHLGYVE